MAILDYEIGGNEVRIDASEGIANIPGNKTLLIEQLTADEPGSPQKVEGLTTIEEVFEHFQPRIDVDFEDEAGQPVKESLKFNSVADFSVKNMTAQSDFLSGLNNRKENYELIIKQLRSNKVLQKALQDPETRQAFIDALTELKKEVEAADNKGTN